MKERCESAQRLKLYLSTKAPVVEPVPEEKPIEVKEEPVQQHTDKPFSRRSTDLLLKPKKRRAIDSLA